ncbi:tripartite tricarboxylate transporter TctB family protein [Kocuria sp. CPCC 205292]|uniref:tripartite tricarboxylate transporter TctB family protein n=1 Tax=Kocuria cellulosilytica TaxID=3071451 RepID=UPI0034D74F9C
MSSSTVAHGTHGPENDVEFEEEPARGGATTARLGALVPLVLGVAGAVVAFGLGIGSLSDPGAGLWPFAISLAMVAASVIALLRAKQDDDVEAFDGGVLPVALSVASLLVYAGLLPVIGFEIPTVLLLVFWIRVLGKEGWRPAVTVAVVATVAVYALFVLVFAVPIPHLF